MRVTVLYQKATANYVPAAAVIRRWRALSGIIGRKEEQAAARVCGERPKLNFGKPWKPGGWSAEEDRGIPCVAVKCVDIWRNTSGEGDGLGRN